MRYGGARLHRRIIVIYERIAEANVRPEQLTGNEVLVTPPFSRAGNGHDEGSGTKVSALFVQGVLTFWPEAMANPPKERIVKLIMRGGDPKYVIRFPVNGSAVTTREMRKIGAVVNRVLEERLPIAGERFQRYRMKECDLLFLPSPIVCTDQSRKLRELVSQLQSLERDRRAAMSRNDYDALIGIMNKIRMAEAHLGTCTCCRWMNEHRGSYGTWSLPFALGPFVDPLLLGHASMAASR